ncbi:MAG: hypothetical protein Q7V10_01090 [Methanobacteriaceae archaeon]|jgi:hypothetical protein|nr:hypothetical protein [Methanobacteriaceae archaeon]MDO9628065.1 hypothetical protein [Methanobacteriaceae archaeon]
MKESKSEKSSSEEKNTLSIFNLAKKALKNLDPNVENLDDSKNHSNDSKDSNDSSKSENESKKSSTETSLPHKDGKSSKSSKNKNNSIDSKESVAANDSKSSFSGISAKFNQFKTSIQGDRQKLFTMIGLAVAVILILLGISFLFGTSDKVSDNVVFGEKSVTSAFFVIIGLLIIAGIYAPKIIGKTSFDNIYQEMKGVEDNSSKKDVDDSKDDDLNNNHSLKESPSKESENEKLIDQDSLENEELSQIPEKEK